jgi:hypothetical protein
VEAQGSTPLLAFQASASASRLRLPSAWPIEKPTQPPNIVPLRSDGTDENRIETAAVDAGAQPTAEVRPHEQYRHSRGWKPKALALATLAAIGAVVVPDSEAERAFQRISAYSREANVLGQAQIYGSRLLGYGSTLRDAIAGLSDRLTRLRTDDAPVAASAAPSSAEPLAMVDSPQSLPYRASSEEHTAGAPMASSEKHIAIAPTAAVGVPAPDAPEDVKPTRSGVGVSSVAPVAMPVDRPLPAARAAEPFASAGTAQASNPSSDLPQAKSSAVVATPNVAAKMLNRSPKPAKKREKSRKSVNAVKLDAAETAASSAPATSPDPPAPDQEPTNPAHGTTRLGRF